MHTKLAKTSTPLNLYAPLKFSVIHLKKSNIY